MGNYFIYHHNSQDDFLLKTPNINEWLESEPLLTEFSHLRQFFLLVKYVKKAKEEINSRSPLPKISRHTNSKCIFSLFSLFHFLSLACL